MKLAVQTGDRYAKVDAPNIIWIVSKSLNIDDSVPHVILVQEGATNRKITLSISALEDASIYKKIEAKPQAG